MSVTSIGKRSTSLDIFRDEDNCSICNTDPVSDACDKCGDGICKYPCCQWAFPTNTRKNYILCDVCFNRIDKKLLNYDHLIIYKFLKKHTKRRQLSY